MAKADTIDHHYQFIATKLSSILETLEDLIEDPIFLDNIHGEEEMGLDLTMELVDSILAKFEPRVAEHAVDPRFEAESFDAD